MADRTPCAAVCVILARAFHPRVSAVVLCTFAAYAAYTVVLTRVRDLCKRQRTTVCLCRRALHVC